MARSIDTPDGTGPASTAGASPPAAALADALDAPLYAFLHRLGDGVFVADRIPGERPDFRYVAANAAFERHTGITLPIGSTIRSLLPEIDEGILDTYVRVLDSGQPERFTAQALAREFDVEAVPTGEAGRIAVIFRDITPQRAAEKALRESEDRQAFLLSLSDALRGRAHADDVAAHAIAMLRDKVGADIGCLIDGEAEARTAAVLHPSVAAGVPTFADTASLCGLADASAKATRIVEDLHADPRSSAAQRGRTAALGLRAFVATSLRAGDQRPAWRLVVGSREPRRWSAAEVALIEDTLERTWAAVERARAEAALRASEERTQFLLELGDALRATSGADALIEVGARRLGERLKASRVLFAEFDELRGLAYVFSGWSTDGAAPFPATMRLADFEGPVLDDMRAGRIVRIPDTADPALARPDLAAIAQVGVGALLSIPLRVAGRLAVNLSVHQFDARTWTDDDVALAQDVAERLWAEVVRARTQAALRESDARRLAMADAAPALVWETDAQGAIYVNRHYLEFFGGGFEDVAGMGWTRWVHPDDLNAYLRAYQKAFERRAPFEHEVRLLRADGQYRWVRSTGRPLGEDRYVGLCIDITEVREAADRLADERERQAFLLEFGDALRVEPTAEAMADCALRMLTARLGLDRCYVGLYRLDDDRAEFPHQVAGAGLPPLPETIRLSDFPEAFRIALDRTLVIEDVEHAPGLSERDRRSITALGFGALVAATLRKGPGRPLWAIVTVSAQPRRWTPGEIALIEDVTERTWSAMERARTEAALSESEQRLRLGAEVARFALWDWNVRTGEVAWSDEHFRMQGYEVGEVTPSYAAWAARVHPDDLADTEAALAKARDTHTEFVREFRSLHPDGSVHWLSARGRFFYSEAGEPVRMIGAMLETTERRQWEDRQQVLVAELQHRTRNIMGVVRAMFERTRRDSSDMATLCSKYADRLAALARVQNLLSRLDDGDRITFDELIHVELSAMGAIDPQGQGPRVNLDGPRGVRMRNSTVQTFALALHELATNANKYGALAQPAGRLDIRWRLEQPDSAPRLCIEWLESGVEMPPAGAAPGGSGYGRELIERALPYQLDAKTRYELGKDGVRCTIEMPVSGG